MPILEELRAFLEELPPRAAIQKPPSARGTVGGISGMVEVGVFKLGMKAEDQEQRWT